MEFGPSRCLIRAPLLRTLRSVLRGSLRPPAALPCRITFLPIKRSTSGLEKLTIPRCNSGGTSLRQRLGFTEYQVRGPLAVLAGPEVFHRVILTHLGKQERVNLLDDGIEQLDPIGF